MALSDYYVDLNIHREILSDEARTGKFENIIKNNDDLFKGKIVLNVGCGLGSLCVFAVRAGAARVIGVEECPHTHHLAEELMKSNKLDHIVTIVRGNIEEVELPFGIEKVDIIISDWMGYSLFYKCKLDAVLFARDKWLLPNGLIFPNEASLHLVAIEYGEGKREEIESWELDDFNMSSMRKTALAAPIVEWVNQNHAATNVFQLREINLYTLQRNDISFSKNFQLTVARNDYIHALLTFFVARFTGCYSPTDINTSPTSPRTSWKQTVFFLDQELKVYNEETIHGVFELISNARNTGKLVVKIGVNFKGRDCEVCETNIYKMY